ncbi:unnamed protein product (macronuclear) [Paramecium tetraurelia]|uniref:Uncharacterized protein n=1 Tax=Paramecium tetraurelia TaxID=5888 RepID=A0EE55_PARTE|nr:uncharacterized protein GSPATT00025916001 [Paramecium tetraurelia]CAK93572.1 unnamed protein product [Paramecium tetraurelia]|eukprot:XP_001460969.1 hypothetical protein (macronuclear) [Paramecium tetraurelia strain d4-2]
MIHIHKICEQLYLQLFYNFQTKNNQNSAVNNPQELLSSRPLNQDQQYYIKQQSFRKVEEWQKQQDLLVKHSQQNNHFIPNYPQKTSKDLSQRYQRHYAQNRSIDRDKGKNELQQKINQSVNVKTDVIEQPIISIKIKTEENQKKSNLRKVKKQTLEKKTVKIEDHRKSNSKSPENQQQQINKPPLPKIMKKEQEQSPVIQSQPGLETVDQFLQKAK